MKSKIILFLILFVETFVFPLSVQGVTFEEINQPSVFVKQQSSVTCTLAAAVNLVRRAAMATGNTQWASITEDSMRGTAWLPGLSYSFTYAGITIKHGNLNGTNHIIQLLNEHPEGIVLYNRSYPHAILATDYSNGTFYCADSGNSTSGRIPDSLAIVTAASCTEYWYVSSPKVTLTTDSEKPVISVSRIENITNTSYDVYLKGTDNLSQKLKFKIGTWNDNMSIDDAKWQTSDFVSSKEIRFTVNISDFGNARDVTYHTNAFVIDESGNTSSAKRVGDPYIASLIGELSCDWIETTILPDNVTTANCEIQYNNHYQKKATMSPGTGWTKTGSEIKQYDNVGSVYKSDNKLSTSETRVQVDYFFYHYCGNSSHPTWVERYEDPSYPTRHEILDYSAYNEAAYYDDSNDPNIKQIELRWKSGQWAGGIATCGTYGQSGERWYRGYKYQDRQLVTYYNWVKDSGWTSSRDSSANSVTIRYRLKNGCGARDITLPAGLKEIQASAFEGSTSINEVTIPNGVTKVGSRAFANCTGLTLVRIPSTVSSIGTSAFLNDTNVTLVCQSNSVCVSYAQQNGHPYRTE